MASRQMRQLAAMVAARMQTKRVHRILANPFTATANATTSLSLLTCDDDPNYDLTSDGSSNVAECHPGAKIIAIQLVMTVFQLDTDDVYHWIIGRDPDGALQAASAFTVATLYTSDVSTTTALLRKNTWACGHFVGSSTRDKFNTPVIISSKALRRSARLADGDVIRMNWTNPHASTDAKVYVRGRIITRGP